MIEHSDFEDMLQLNVTNLLCFGQVLRYDASNIEATACLGSYHFYSDQPEVSMMYLRRILQMGE